MVLSAHDGDLKEANKQKCQHPMSQMVFQSQPQSAAPHQYLQRPTLQYTQQNLAQTHGPSPYLTHTTTLQPSTTLGQGQAQTISASLDPKGNLPTRGYQLNALYTCATPQFDR